MYDKSKISEKVIRLERSIEKEEKIKVLQSWYDNIKNYQGISEYGRAYDRLTPLQKKQIENNNNKNNLFQNILPLKK
jgi:hypothetical protein